MRCSIVFIFLAITFGRSLSQHCEMDESQHECGGYCYGAVKPVLEYLAILQKRVESCEAKQPADILSKLALMDEKLESLAIQQDLEKRSTAKSQELELQVAAVRQEMVEQIETLQELEKSSQEKFNKLDEKCQKLELQQASDRKEIETELKNIDLFKKIGTKYYYIEDKMDERTNWQGALDNCHEMGAHLVSLQSEDELKALRRFLDSDHIYWIDLNDIETEGEYISATTGIQGTFFHWHENEPNNFGNGERCVELNTYLNGKEGWMNDVPCSQSHDFICEMAF
ncbi:CD209 antigen-like protein B [Drosophila obscura]|uniref:CD209 antigen-like protein B n=1 Tax=Drosophila obscura TaxID=7282 RepID=UPI001BB29086|nr:CD209 antigen-like protein B [Drosophila obscura]